MADDGFSFNLIPGLDKQLHSMLDLNIHARAAAEKIAGAAKGLAPEDRGEYAASIHAENTPSGARVVATDEAATFLEFGVPSHGIPARFVLRRAVEAAGYSFAKRGG